MTRAECKTAITALCDAADLVIEKAKEGGYLSGAAYEADANLVRADVRELMTAVGELWGAGGNAAIRALRKLGASLLDLREGVSDTKATVEVEITRTTSAIELAVARYGDFSRYTEIVALNPGLAHPGFIRPGTTLVMYVR